MKCTKCNHYSYSLRKCKLGKANPRTVKGGVEVAQFMGISYICSRCDVRDKILEKLGLSIDQAEYQAAYR